ncbi:hypothetical protein ACIOHE_23840 [Streptomyces sp. NPDC087851]
MEHDLADSCDEYAFTATDRPEQQRRSTSRIPSSHRVPTSRRRSGGH